MSTPSDAIVGVERSAAKEDDCSWCSCQPSRVMTFCSKGCEDEARESGGAFGDLGELP